MAVLQSRHLNLRSSIDSGAILLLTSLASRYDQHACGQNGSTVCRPLPFAESTGTHTRSPASPGTCCCSMTRSDEYQNAEKSHSTQTHHAPPRSRCPRHPERTGTETAMRRRIATPPCHYPAATRPTVRTVTTTLCRPRLPTFATSMRTRATAACPATRSAARSSSIPARRRRPVPAKRRPHCHRQPARCHDHCIGPAVWHADFRRHTYPHRPAPACRTGRGTPPSPPYSRYGPAHRTLNQLRPRGCCVSVPS